MRAKDDVACFDFGDPAVYRIVIQGTVSESWRRRLGGMEVATLFQEAGEPRTSLQGQLRDQAALHGLLGSLYALHLPILEVMKIEDCSDIDATERQVQGMPHAEATLRRETMSRSTRTHFEKSATD